MLASHDGEEDARERLLDTPSYVNDGVIALRLADYLTANPNQHGWFHLFAIEDKSLPELPSTDSRKNLIHFKTRDREEARGWIVQAALVGYAVLKGNSSWPVGGPGTLAQIRARFKR